MVRYWRAKRDLIGEMMENFCIAAHAVFGCMLVYIYLLVSNARHVCEREEGEGETKKNIYIFFIA